MPTGALRRPNNSIHTFADGTPLPGVPVLSLPANFGAFTPVTDRGVISTGPTPTSQRFPGIQVEGWFADDPTHQARFLLRLPDDWNGRLVVAGASGTRSEYNGDFAWSDYVLPKGYAYASQNKGVLNFYTSISAPSTSRLPTRVVPPQSGPRVGALSLLWVHFYDNDPDKPFTRWTQYMLETAELAQGAREGQLRQHSRAAPTRSERRTAATRCAVRSRKRRTCSTAASTGKARSSTPHAPNILIDLPPAMLNFPALRRIRASIPNSAAAQNILAAGYPPDIVHRTHTAR